MVVPFGLGYDRCPVKQVGGSNRRGYGVQRLLLGTLLDRASVLYRIGSGEVNPFLLPFIPMADSYVHVSGIPALSADFLVEVNKQVKRLVQDRSGAAEARVVVDNSTTAVSDAATAAATTAARAAIVASTTRVVAAGAAAGDITVAGMTGVKVIAAVVGVKDSDQTNHDFTSEFTAATGKINNTGGTATTGYHLVVVFYS